MKALLMAGWSWSEMVLLQGILLFGILGVGFIVSPFVNHVGAEHERSHSGVHMLQWREATPEEELLWRLRQQQEASR